MLTRYCPGRSKGSKDKIKRKPKTNIQKVYIEGIVFNDAYEASKHLNIHPVNIRRRCRLEKYPEWKYISEEK